MKTFVVNSVGLILGIVGIIALVVLVFLVMFFGRLMKHQWKIWLLRNKGYTQIRHIKEDMTEKYYFLRIKNEHFDFDNGIYMEQKDTRTKGKTILAPLDYGLLSKKEDENLTAEEKQIKGFLQSIKDSKIMDITTLSWGIPTLTYYGTDPNPVNVKERKKVYDAKNISAMIKRIIMTKEWKLVRLVLILCVICLGLYVVLGFLNYSLINKANENLAFCQTALNYTQYQYTELLNSTRVFEVVGNSTITI